MPSSLAWIDASRDEQRRMRELLNLFAETESRDELGVGQIRDALSDLLFPGISTLHTRARYLLIVPWCYQDAEHQGLHGPALTARVDKSERQLIATLKTAGATDGLIGRVAGIAVKTLPSTIYWSALGTFGVRLDDRPGAPLERRIVGRAPADELADRSAGMWHPTTPPAPEGFPRTLEAGLDLQPAEARWLRERMYASEPDTLLTHLLADGRRPRPDSPAPWDDPATANATTRIRDMLHHAELFSLAMHGAALLYNLLVGEEYENAGLTKVEYPVETYREALAEWAQRVRAHPELPTWDVTGLWDQVVSANPRIASNVLGRRFVDAWLDAVTSGRAANAADDPDLRNLVRERELSIKRPQSRFVNPTLLRTWSGYSGSGRLVFRWPQARRIVTDVHAGVEEEPVRAAA